MKNFSLFVILFGISVSLCAQINMYVWMRGERTKYPVTLVDSVTFAEEPPFAPLISVTDASVSDWRDVRKTLNQNVNNYKVILNKC